VGVVVQMNDGRGLAVNGNDAGEWSSDGIVLWLGGGKIETRLSSEDTHRGQEDLFIAMESGSQMTRRG
jgi:hypothetical protein